MPLLSINQLINNHASRYITLESRTFKLIVLTAVIVLIASIISAYILTLKKARKQNETVWNSSSKRLLINFSIPLFTGGILILLLLKNGTYGLIAPMTLIFY